MNNTRTSIFLMANLGAEVNKIISAKEKKDFEMLRLAIGKAQSIIDQFQTLPETKHNKEISILSDVIGELGQESSKYSISTEHLKSYFYPFIFRHMHMM